MGPSPLGLVAEVKSLLRAGKKLSEAQGGDVVSVNLSVLASSLMFRRVCLAVPIWAWICFFAAVEGEILKSLGHVFVGDHESLYIHIYIYLCIFLQIHDIPVYLGWCELRTFTRPLPLDTAPGGVEACELRRGMVASNSSDVAADAESFMAQVPRATSKELTLMKMT